MGKSVSDKARKSFECYAMGCGLYLLGSKISSLGIK
jgi:hypothetical protein